MTSGTGYTILATLVALYGEDGAFDYLKRLRPNVVRYTQSGTAQGPSVARGEVGIGVSFVHEFITQQLSGFPVDIAIPCEGTGDALGGMAIVANGPNPAEARSFYDWALTRSAQELANRTRNLILPANQGANPAGGGALRVGPHHRRGSGEIRGACREEAVARALAARNRRRVELTPAHRRFVCASAYNPPVNEFELIARFFTRPARGSSVRLSVGDDAALLAPSPSCELAVSVDMLVGGRHFFADTDPEKLGHKTLAVNLSDMAAMGASPRWALLAGALPDGDPTWLAAFARGFHALADAQASTRGRRHDARSAFAPCVTTAGEPAGRALLRSGRVGDVMYRACSATPRWPWRR